MVMSTSNTARSATFTLAGVVLPTAVTDAVPKNGRGQTKMGEVKRQVIWARQFGEPMPLFTPKLTDLYRQPSMST